MSNIEKNRFFPELKERENSAMFPGKGISEIRKQQTGVRYGNSRQLKSEEVEILKQNRCEADDWALISVTDPFDSSLVKRTVFKGVVRIGCLEKGIIKAKDREYYCGISDSFIISSDIGDYCAIHNNRYISAVITGSYVVLSDNNEIYTTEDAKFGNSILKEGEDKTTLRKINLVNEKGGRSISAFTGITGAEIYLWIKQRESKEFISKLETFTCKSFDSRKGYYSFFDDHTVIKGTSLVRNVMTGRCCRIKRAVCVDDVTINSSALKPSLITDNVIVKRGIVGEGCRIANSSIAEDFILDPGSSLDMGVRFLHSFLGTCSNISCCEIISSFIYPLHQQHHNSSFLIASVVMGQSNIAAGATLGSNHNSRANDCEMWAGRGFWPALCSSVKFNSKFASYCLLSKSDFPYELNISLPFALVNNNVYENCLEILPAYWWLYNMYSLFRNYFKFMDRSAGLDSIKGVEFDFMAPDTAEEILSALSFIKEKQKSNKLKKSKASNKASNKAAYIKIPALGIENSKREVKILYPDKSKTAYTEMLIFYCGSVIFDFIGKTPDNINLLFKTNYSEAREKEWVNACGRLLPKKSIVNAEKAVMGKSKTSIESWEEMHDYFNEEFELYESRKLLHALSVAMVLYKKRKPDENFLNAFKTDYKKLLKKIEQEIIKSRKKDYDDPIRKALFSNTEEMESVLGPLEKDSLVGRFRKKFVEPIFQLTLLLYIFTIFSMKYSDTFIINSFNVDITGMATPAVLCAIMQETASRQCVDLGISIDELAKHNQTWMLAKQYVKFLKYPAWRSSITAETWPRNKTGLRALRDFVIKDENGQEIASSVTNWMLIDVSTRRLCKIDETIKNISITEESVMPEDFKIKVEKSEGEKSTAIFRVRPSDFDMNAHVTSTCYIKWILDTVPFEFHKTHSVSELYAEYVEEISSEVEVHSIAYMKENGFYHELINMQTERVVFRGQTAWQAHT